jgi:hypothetical protein
VVDTARGLEKYGKLEEREEFAARILGSLEFGSEALDLMSVGKLQNGSMARN